MFTLYKKKYSLKKHIIKPDRIYVNTIFSEKEQRETYSRKKKKKSCWYSIINISLFSLLIAISIIQGSKLIHTLTTWQIPSNFFEAATTVLGTLFVLSFTLLFFYYETISKKYLFLDLNYLVKDPILISLFSTYLLTLILNLTSLLIGFKPYLEITSVGLTYFSVISLPFFIKRCHQLLGAKKIVEMIEFSIIKNITKKEVREVEKQIQDLGALLLKSIELRDRHLFKLTVDKIHDLAKFYVSTHWQFKHNFLESVFQKDKLSSRSGWFFTELMSPLELAYYHSIENKMNNYANRILGAISSIGTKTLNYERNNHYSERILRLYCRVIIFSTKNDFSDEKGIVDPVIGQFRMFFQRHMALEERDFLFLITDFFSEEFIIELLKIKPTKLVTLTNLLIITLKDVGSIEKINPLNARILGQVCSEIIYISKKIEKLGDLSGSTKYLNGEVRKTLERYVLICSLVLLFYDHDDEAKKLKKYYTRNKLFNEKKVIKKIQENKEEYEDYFKTYDEEGNTKFFNEVKFKKIIRQFKK